MLLDNVKSLCASRNITIAELERGVKAGNGTIRKWNDSSPSADRLEAVADYFNVSTDFLLGRDTLSNQARELAKTVDRLPPEKQDLIKCYIKVIQKEGVHKNEQPYKNWRWRRYAETISRQACCHVCRN